MQGKRLSRRVLLQMTGGAAVMLFTRHAFSESRPQTETTGLIAHPLGAYRFLPGTAFLSFAAVAADGFEIVRAALQTPRPFPQCLADIEKYLKALGRPMHALCGLELRNGRPVTRDEFNAFNESYVERLRPAGLLVGHRVPIARTNVAATGGSDGHELHAFTYTVPTLVSDTAKGPTFVLSAAPDSRAATVIAQGDTSPTGLQQKLSFIVDTLNTRMDVMGLDWNDITGVQLYTLHDVHALLPALLLARLGRARRYGVQWHHAQPPVQGADVELDFRSIRIERVVPL